MALKSSFAFVVISPPDHHQVVLAYVSHATRLVRVLGQAGIQDGIGDGIAHFIGMAFADDLRRKDVILAHSIKS